MNNQIVVTYKEKTRRLILSCPFYLVDVAREFPSRRFDPKTKAWVLPLSKANVLHLRDAVERYEFAIHPEAVEAIKNFEALIQAPKKIPFPKHAYDFTRSKLGFVPMDHQHDMLDLSWGLRPSAWIAKMGTGKTYAAVHLAFARWVAGQIDAVVVICPSTLRKTWEKEFAKYATGPYDFRIHDTKARWYPEFCKDNGEQHLPVLAVSVEGFGVSEQLFDSVCGFYTNGKRVMTVCDESSRIKNPDAKRTKRTIEIGAVSKYNMILNGTPIAVGVQDLWSQYEFLDPNIIGMDYWSFKTRYMVMGGYENKQVVGYQNVDELMNMIRPYTIEVSKDVLKLPPKVMTERYVTVTPEQRKLLKLVIKGTLGDPDEPLIKVENALEKVLRCRQIVGGWLPRGHLVTKQIEGQEVQIIETRMEPLAHNPKLDDLMAMIEDNFAGSKFIIWSTFVHEIDAIHDRLAQKYGQNSVARYYGATDQDSRSIIEDRYCNDPEFRFFVGNPATAGLGLTLISGENDIMAYYSGTNAYIDRAQSEDRAHRIGQNNSVTVVDMIAEKTVDELIAQSIREKMDVERFVVENLRKGIKLDDLLLQD